LNGTTVFRWGTVRSCFNRVGASETIITSVNIPYEFLSDAFLGATPFHRLLNKSQLPHVSPSRGTRRKKDPVTDAALDFGTINVKITHYEAQYAFLHPWGAEGFFGASFASSSSNQ
jgi:hypothetical protein